MSKVCLIQTKNDGNDADIMSRWVRHWYAHPLLDGFETISREDMPHVKLLKPSVTKLRKRLKGLKTHPDPIRKTLRAWIEGSHAESVFKVAAIRAGIPITTGAELEVEAIGEEAVVSQLLGRLSDFVGEYTALANAGEDPEIMVGF